MALQLKLTVENNRASIPYLKSDTVRGFVEVTPCFHPSDVLVQLLQKISLGEDRTCVVNGGNRRICFDVVMGAEKPDCLGWDCWDKCSPDTTLKFPFKFDDVQFTHDTLDGDAVFDRELVMKLPVSLRYFVRATLFTADGLIVQEKELPVMVVDPRPVTGPAMVSSCDHVIALTLNMNMTHISMTDLRALGVKPTGFLDIRFPRLSSKCVVKAVVVDLHQTVSVKAIGSFPAFCHDKIVKTIYRKNIEEPDIGKHYLDSLEVDLTEVEGLIPSYNGVFDDLFTVNHTMKIYSEVVEGRSYYDDEYTGGISYYDEETEETGGSRSSEVVFKELEGEVKINVYRSSTKVVPTSK